MDLGFVGRAGMCGLLIGQLGLVAALAGACGSAEPNDDPIVPPPRRSDAGGSDPSDAGLPQPVDGGGLELVQLVAGHAYTCALWNDGVLKCWGDNAHGQLGLGDRSPRGTSPESMGAALPAVDLGVSESARVVSTGSDHVCAALVSGKMKCWGMNYFGSLGLPDDENRGGEPESMGNALPAVELGTNARARDLAMGSYSSCALLEDGSVKCWGDSIGGELGYGDDRQRGGAEGLPMGDALSVVDVGLSNVRKIQMGLGIVSQHTCAMNEAGQLKCWGGNTRGQLGLGDVQNRGDAAGEMGGMLPVVPVGERVSSFAVGEDATCAITDAGRLRCWGNNEWGQLGQGDTTSRGHDFEHRLLPLVELGSTARVIDVDLARHTCAVLDDRQIKCWGANESGQTGQAAGEDIGDGPDEMGANLLAVDYGDDDAPVQVAAGDEHTCVRFASHRVKCWGFNDKGQLGYGDTAARHAGEAGTMGANLPYVDLGR